MKKTLSISTLLFICMVSLSFRTYAQFPEDVLRLSTPGFGVGARSIGMGMAYTGVANDFSAAYYNPAGLAQLRMNEVSVGLQNVSFGNTGSFFGNDQSLTNSGTNLNSLGLVYAVPTQKGSLVLAIGFNRQSDFTTGLSFAGFNPNSSIVQAFAPDGGLTQNPSGNMAYELYLANADSLGPNTYRWDSKITDNVTQSGKVLESGGLNHISFSGAVETARNLYLGATLNVITGSYDYQRNYYEDDLRNFYTTTPFDFKSLSLLETVESDLSGVNLNLGFLYKFSENSRVGISVKTPSWISVDEVFSQTGTSDFDNNDHFTFVAADREHNQYDVTTPFVFSAGLSYGIRMVMLTADLDYTDWTQMEFRNANANLLTYNTQIKEEFQPTADVHIGAEVEAVPGTLQLRGGFAYLRSPYQNDPANFDKKYITAGAGFLVADAIAIDLAFAHGFWKNFRVNYDATSRVDEDITTNNLIGTVSYRF
jgi:long-subunit fatty acid transport protein